MLGESPVGFLVTVLFLSLSNMDSRAASPCQSLLDEILGPKMPPGVRHIPTLVRRRLFDFIGGQDNPLGPFTIASYNKWHSISESSAAIDIRLGRLSGVLDKVEGSDQIVLRPRRDLEGWEAFHKYGRETDFSVALLLDIFRTFKHSAFNLEKVKEALGLPSTRNTKDNFLRATLEGVVTGVLERDSPQNYRFLVPPKPYSGRENRIASKLEKAGVPLTLWRRASGLKEYILDYLLEAFEHIGPDHPFTIREIARLRDISPEWVYKYTDEAIRLDLMAKVSGIRDRYIFRSEETLSERTEDILVRLLKERRVDPKVWEKAHLLGPLVHHRLVKLFESCKGLSCPTTKSNWDTRRLAFFVGIMRRGPDGIINRFRRTPGPRGWKLLKQYDPRGTGLTRSLAEILRFIGDREVTQNDLLTFKGRGRTLRAGRLMGILQMKAREDTSVYSLATPQRGYARGRLTPRRRVARKKELAPEEWEESIPGGNSLGRGQGRPSGGHEDDILGETPETSQDILEREGPEVYRRLHEALIPQGLWSRAHAMSPLVLRKLIGIVMKGKAHESFEARDSEMIIPFFLGIVHRAPGKKFILAREEGLRGTDLLHEWGDSALSYRISETLDFLKGAAFSFQEYEDIAKTMVPHGNYPSFALDIRVATLAGLVEKRGGQFIPK